MEPPGRANPVKTQGNAEFAMLKIDADTLYSLDELREKLAGIVELPTLLERLGLRDRRVFRDAIFGFEILEAARQAKPFSELSQTSAAILDAPGVSLRRGSRTRPAKLAKFSARDPVT